MRGASAIDNQFLYTGQRWFADLGLYYYRNRWYDPHLGRFLSRDPLGIWGDPMNLGNGTAYVGLNPWTFVDPLGLFCFGILDFSEKPKVGPGVLDPAYRTSMGLSNDDLRLHNLLHEHYVGVAQDNASEAAATGAAIAEAGEVAVRVALEPVDTILTAGEVASALGESDIGGAAIASTGFLPFVPGAAAKVARSGQLHHAISKRVHNALESHPVLGGHYRQRDPRLTIRAKDMESHRGYQQWHRDLDKEVVTWLDRYDEATPEQFEAFLRDRYSKPDLKSRFPGELGCE